jgi:hypothetical protein
MRLEYRMAKELEELGKLDGNERWLPVPVGRADLERTVNRVEGLKLVSFSQKEDGKDVVCSARLDFAAPQAFTAFFDATGQQAELDMAKRRLVFTFTGSGGLSPGFRDFAAESLSGYAFSLSLNLPAAVSLRWLDENGAETRSPGASFVTSVKGSSLDFTASMADLVLLDQTLAMEVRW